MTYNDNPTVDFNLDTYRAEAETRPFVVVHGGKPWQFKHVDECDGWEVAEAFAGNSAKGADIAVIEKALGDEFVKFKQAARLNRGAMTALIKRYLAHCGIDSGN